MSVTVIISCKDDNSSPIPEQSNFFPLAVGNTWEYEQASPTGYNDFGGIKKEITDVVKLEGREYYRMVTIWKSIPNPYRDTTYYRVNDNGFVYYSYRFLRHEVTIISSLSLIKTNGT